MIYRYVLPLPRKYVLDRPDCSRSPIKLDSLHSTTWSTARRLPKSTCRCAMFHVSLRRPKLRTEMRARLVERLTHTYSITFYASARYLLYWCEADLSC